MYRFSRTTGALLVLFGAILTSSSFAAAPTSISQVIEICTPVIDEEYNGNDTHRGVCVTATQEFLTASVGPPATVADPNQTIADLVFELVKLYRDGDICKQYDTELPEAIALAATVINEPADANPSQKALIEQIAETIRACQTIDTGAISDVEAISVSPE